MGPMARLVAILLAFLVLASQAPLSASRAASDMFLNPPDSVRPWVYWFWLNGNITKHGITADLEAMNRVGIGGVLIMEVDQGAPVGPVAFTSDEWRELFKHVVTEAGRLGMEVNMNNDAGWNGSGGPWITPELSMKKVVVSEAEITGPGKTDLILKQPETIAGLYKDIAVIAFPTPESYQIPGVTAKAAYDTVHWTPVIPSIPSAKSVVAIDRLVDLSAGMDSSGRLVWDAPEGKWTVLRVGFTSTGASNTPAPMTGVGLEPDKLAPEGAETAFNGMIAKLIADVGPAAGKTFTAMHVDSWETGVWERSGEVTRVALSLEPSGSVFVVFRQSAAGSDPIVSITRDGARVLSTAYEPPLRRVVRRAVYGVPGDPAFMHVKTVEIDYALVGVRRTITPRDPDVLSLAPPATLPSPRVSVRLASDGAVRLTAQKKGAYTVGFASARTANVKLPGEQIVGIAGAWRVLFPPHTGAPAGIAMNKLISLSEHADPGAKHFSGIATYRITFDAPASIFGKNTLEVEVANLWPNRMIGDEFLPEDSPRDGNGVMRQWPDWVMENKPSPTGRHTFTSWRLWKKGDALPPSGLTGPVVIRSASAAEVR